VSNGSNGGTAQDACSNQHLITSSISSRHRESDPSNVSGP
jgi:hypothetical protein